MTTAIATHDLTKHFGPVVALEGMDLEVRRGETFGFLGPNGAGKSTTVRLLLNLIGPTRGTAEIMGVPVGDVEQAHRHVGYVAGDVAFWPQLTGTETLDLLGNLSRNVDAPFRDELVERLQLDPSKRIRSYSKGNRQKIALVAAFMTRPDVLLLDEPTSGLDPLMEAQFQAIAREAAARGQTIFLSSHILDEVEDLCDRVGILRAGKLIEVAVDGPFPVFDDVPGVTGVDLIPGGARLSVTGSPAALLTRLASLPVKRFRTDEPTLEEIFLTYY
jgi:ABC-2 type transport system ATP-binding protein